MYVNSITKNSYQIVQKSVNSLLIKYSSTYNTIIYDNKLDKTLLSPHVYCAPNYDANTYAFIDQNCGPNRTIFF